MALSKKFSAFAGIGAPTSTLRLAGYDPARAAGDRNVTIPSVGLAPISLISHTLNLGMSVGTNTDYQPLFAVMPDPGVPCDIIIQSLEITIPTIGGGTYDFVIAVHGNDNLYHNFYRWYDQGLGFVSAFRFRLPYPLVIPYAFQNGNQVYIRFSNETSDRQMAIDFQVVASLIAPPVSIVVPQYTDPAPYTGPLFSDVYVGPTRTANTGDQYTEPLYALRAIADAGRMHVDRGDYFLPFGIANPADFGTGFEGALQFGANPTAPLGACRFATGITIIGSGTYGANATIFNGRGGVGGGFRLTFGKGFIYDRCGITVQGVRFLNCGGADNNGDGEAGIYVEDFDPSSGNTTHIYKCAFDGNENGIFSPGPPADFPNAAYVKVRVDNCDFGFAASNGTSHDGFSHDFYINCQQLTCTNNNFYGCLYGNQMKSRSPVMTVTGGFVNQMSGRVIDYPSAGSLTVTGLTMQNDQNCTINFLSYAIENQLNTISNPTFTNCTLNISRFDTHLWMNDATHHFDFVAPTVNWYTFGGAPPDLTPTRDNSSEDATAATGLPSLTPPPGVLGPPPALPARVSYP